MTNDLVTMPSWKEDEMVLLQGKKFVSYTLFSFYRDRSSQCGNQCWVDDKELKKKFASFLVLTARFGKFLDYYLLFTPLVRKKFILEDTLTYRFAMRDKSGKQLDSEVVCVPV